MTKHRDLHESDEYWQARSAVRAPKVHRRYSDKADRPDLRSLAVCNNINGPIDDARLTSDDEKVTCGRCRRIAGSVPVNAPPFSRAALRRNSRNIAQPDAVLVAVERWWRDRCDATLTDLYAACAARFGDGRVRGE